MSWKRLFSRALGADPGRLHMAAHSHHLWPDASFDGQVAAWEDAARLADGKWDKVMGEVWPQAQANVAGELNLPDPNSVVFASNTHDFLVRLISAIPHRPVRILSTGGEFHSFRRQSARWRESGEVRLETVEVEPSRDLEERFLRAARAGEFDILFLSQVLFGSGQVIRNLAELAGLSAAGGSWLVIDGYHGFMAVPTDFGGIADRAFYTAGGYKYAMSGEGVAFLHAPPGYAQRPAVTGWYADFDARAGVQGEIAYPEDARRFMGSTFDPTGLYRFNAVQAMLAAEGLTTALISNHVAALQAQLVERLEGTLLAGAELLNPPGGAPQARFLALRHRNAAHWCDLLAERGVTVDVRNDVLRLGLGIYHDSSDIDRFIAVARRG